MSAIDRCIEAARSGEVLSPEGITAARAELARLRTDNERLRSALEGLVDVQPYAIGWDNGVTDSTGTLNEADYLHGQRMERARAALEPLP